MLVCVSNYLSIPLCVCVHQCVFGVTMRVGLRILVGLWVYISEDLYEGRNLNV